MRNRLKRNMALMSIAIILIFNIENVATCVYGSEIENNEISYMETDEEFSDFSEIKDDYEYIGNKVEDEINQSSGIIENEELEKYLNENGVFDEDIASLCEEDDIEEFNEITEEDIDNMDVSIEYYAVLDEQVDEQSEEIDDTEMVRLNDEQIEMYIAEKYYGEETALNDELNEKLGLNDDENEEGLLDKIAMYTGLQPITVYAETQTKQGNHILKKIVWCQKENNSSYVDVIATAVWDTMPANRNLDAIALCFNLGQYEPDATNGHNRLDVIHFWNETKWEGYNASCLNKIYSKRQVVKMKLHNSKKLNEDQYSYNSGYIGMAIRLHNSGDDVDTFGTGNVTRVDIQKEGVRCRVYVRLTSLQKKELDIDINYLHTKVTAWYFVNVFISAAYGNYINAVIQTINGGQTATKTEQSGSSDGFVFKFK